MQFIKGLGIVSVIAFAILLIRHYQNKDEDKSSMGSVLAFFVLMLLFLGYGFNYLYGLLSPWDPLGIYQHNRTYMGIYV